MTSTERLSDLGVMGMAVMGRNLAMNAASKGLKVSVYNRTTSRMEDAVAEAQSQDVCLNGFAEMGDFVKSLKSPRVIIVMVQAGAAVDATLSVLIEHLNDNDIVVDGGNEFYTKTDRRAEMFKAKKIRFIGMGVSGGEEGARHGPSMMVGTDEECYNTSIRSIVELMAAKVGKDCCVARVGDKSAGNYVKMVHNGIEYGDMQLIAEVYWIFKSLLNQSNEQIADIFSKKFMKGKLNSYLIEITAVVLRTRHPDRPDESLLDDVLDVAGNKGTGMWTAQEAAARGIPCPTIQAALDSRYLSALVDVREQAQTKIKLAPISSSKKEGEQTGKGLVSSLGSDLTVDDVEDALYLAKICSYAQGMMLLKKASDDLSYNINLSEVAKIWRGGCIIRAELLQKISNAFDSEPGLSNLLLSEQFTHDIEQSSAGLRRCVVAAQGKSLSIPALSASNNYLNALVAPRLPLNLVQAQRDHFGSHTFKLRSDPSRTVHADWSSHKWAHHQ